MIESVEGNGQIQQKPAVYYDAGSAVWWVRHFAENDYYAEIKKCLAGGKKGLQTI